MIFKHLAQNVRSQDWFAVFIEFIIVVVGIFVGLQVNNWNEDRLALNETKDYLAKKLVRLEEDTNQLNDLLTSRKRVRGLATNLLDKGYDAASDYEIVNLITIASVERKLISAIKEEQRTSPVTYFKNIAGTGIEDLEQDYINLVNVITFSESRLNVFSEELENDLWRTGFFTDNRKLFEGAWSYTEDEYNAAGYPPLVRSEDHAIDSLLAIVRRNEINAKRLIEQYDELLAINQALQDAINRFLNKT